VDSVILTGDDQDPNFIPYEQLTEEIVINWIKNNVGEEVLTSIEENIEIRIQNRITELANPPFLQGKPWENK
jgi:hypothetical protein